MTGLRWLTGLGRPGDGEAEPTGDPEPTVRFVARPTQVYARLLSQSTAPDVLVDGVERELILERLYRATGTAPPGLIRAEVDAMRGLDVPLFTVPFSRTDLVADADTLLHDVLAEAPAARTQRRLRAVVDRIDQVDDLRATLFAMNPDEAAVAGSGAAAEVEAQVARRELVNLILERAIDVGDGTVAWIGLEHDPNRNRWTYGRMSAGLTGQAGIGLALAAAAVAGDAPVGCAAAAKAALLGSVERFRRSDVGPTDAFGGPAGVLYAAVAAARLLNDTTLREAAGSLLVPCLLAARKKEPALVIDGAAGAVLALLHLPAGPAVADALTELVELVELADLDTMAGAQQADQLFDAPDCWSRSLPSQRYGRALARHRLAGVRPPAGHLPELPVPVGPGDAIAQATLLPPAWSSRPAVAGAGLRTLLDEAVLAQTAAAFGGDHRWAARRDRLVEGILSHRAQTGRWSASRRAPDSTWLSPVHGLPALSMLIADLGPDLPIARAFS